MATTLPPTTDNADQVAFDAMTDNIKKTIDDQNSMYNRLKSASDSTFTENRKTYNIEQGVSDVKTRREEIWRFLQDKYNENTKLRKYLFEKELANKRELEAHTKELDYLKSELSKTNTQYDTSTRNIQNEMYNQNRYIYMFHLYKLLILVQILLLIIVIICSYGYLSNMISMIIILVILFITVLYIIYYVYFNNNNRNSFDWNKFYYGEPNISGTGQQCSPVVSAEGQELKDLAANADTILNKYISSASSCYNSPTATPATTATPASTATPPIF
jgi:hypothetical protein